MLIWRSVVNNITEGIEVQVYMVYIWLTERAYQLQLEYITSHLFHRSQTFHGGM